MPYIKQASYLHRRGAVYQYIRRVPCDIRPYYKTNQLYFSLRTTSLLLANRIAKSITQKLDDYWLGIRLQKIDIPKIAVVDLENTSLKTDISLSQATQLYLNLKGAGKSKTFRQAAIRNSAYVIDLLGDRNIVDYSTADAGKFRNWLISRELKASSIRRIFGTIRSIINPSISECGLSCSNGFSNIYLPAETKTNPRKTIPISNIKNIQNVCRELDDDRRWLISLISDTGARLSEIAGLLISDINVETDYPYLRIQPHPWRSLKTKSSERNVPLVGAALWSAQLYISPISKGSCPRVSSL